MNSKLASDVKVAVQAAGDAHTGGQRLGENLSFIRAAIGILCSQH